MPTQIITLTKTPVRITTGSESVFIQSKSGREFSFAHSTTSPDITAGAHTSKEVFIASPFIIWAWSNIEEPIKVAVSVA